MTKLLKNILQYSAAPILSLITFAFLFQIWQIDLLKPIISYDSDALFSEFVVKTIIESGWFFTNNAVGLPHLENSGFFLYDYPIYGDSFHFLLIKFLAVFSSNTFLVTNCFFILTFPLVAFTSFVVLRSFKITFLTALLISNLFSFLPYHFYRGVYHLFLSNYMAIPLIIMVAMWIVERRIELFSVNKKRQFCLSPNRFFFGAFFIGIFAATNGIYYGIYAGVIFIFAWFLSYLKNGQCLNRYFANVIVLCVSIGFILFCLHVPSLIYWFSHGFNGSLANRDPYQSEMFSLKIVNIFLPVANHYLSYFRHVRDLFDTTLPIYEANFASLGIVGAGGFLFLLLLPIVNMQNGEKSAFTQTVKKFSLNSHDQNLIGNLAGLNFLMLIFATVGGLVMLFVMSFPLIRSHARFSIFIGFCAMFLIAILFDKIVKRGNFWSKILIIVISTIALFDQVGMVSANNLQSQKMLEKFSIDQEFVQKIEQSMSEGSMIFVMPSFGFPENTNYDLLTGYLNSKKLRWSYPVMTGRDSYLWQQKVVEMDFDDFIAELKNAGFSGIYVSRIEMSKKYDWEYLRKFEAKLRKIAKAPMISSGDINSVFYEI